MNQSHEIYDEIPKKKRTFGTSHYKNRSPSSTNKVDNIRLTYEEGLKLHQQLGMAINKMSEFNFSTKMGKNSTINVTIHQDSQAIMVGLRNPKK